MNRAVKLIGTMVPAQARATLNAHFRRNDGGVTVHLLTGVDPTPAVNRVIVRELAKRAGMLS